MTEELRARVEKLRDECSAMSYELDALADATRDDMDARFRYFAMAEGFQDAVVAVKLDLGQPAAPTSPAQLDSAYSGHFDSSGA